eukprot:TRINITY_DN21583_c0_g1_i1.p1 TRINITY_DN21583_c0_g1~~TRINITY_DN21583_c0_g1_i1.p1  ORF type:complete len:823 (-),score=123.89 TRINITY_DN21583_c0_g1_i1:365-2833(-)
MLCQDRFRSLLSQLADVYEEDVTSLEKENSVLKQQLQTRGAKAHAGSQQQGSLRVCIYSAVCPAWQSTSCSVSLRVGSMEQQTSRILEERLVPGCVEESFVADWGPAGTVLQFYGDDLEHADIQAKLTGVGSDTFPPMRLELREGKQKVPMHGGALLECDISYCPAASTTNALPSRQDLPTMETGEDFSQDDDHLEETLTTIESPIKPTHESQDNDGKVAHLAKLFRVLNPDCFLDGGDLKRTLKRNVSLHALPQTLTPSLMDDVVNELRSIHSKTNNRAYEVMQDPMISWSSFVDVMLLPDLMPYVSPNMATLLCSIQGALLSQESIGAAVPSAILRDLSLSATHCDDEDEDGSEHRRLDQRRACVLSAVTSASTLAVVLSFSLLGFSLEAKGKDEQIVWTMLEVCFTMTFLAEVAIKYYILRRDYLCGDRAVWNWLEIFLTLVAIIDVSVSFVQIVEDSSKGAVGRLLLPLRGLRLARMARLVKLMRVPMLAQLANMMSGFLIGGPWLICVIAMLLFIIYVTAIMMRTLAFTIPPGCFDRFGSGDLYDFNMTQPLLVDASSAGCKLVYMYTEEYCGSLTGCMFTIFRCMTGDCTTMGGRSLTEIWSKGYGTRFSVFYATAMIVVIFGIFNIITALFIEATLSGLKSNELHRKYDKLTETGYVKKKMHDLVIRLTAETRALRRRHAPMSKVQSILGNGLQVADQLFHQERQSTISGLHEEIFLSELEFLEIMKVPKVRDILRELDIVVELRAGVFEAFKINGDGAVSMSELLSGLMKLRGDIQKTDMVAQQMLIGQLKNLLMDLRGTILRNIAQQHEPIAR